MNKDKEAGSKSHSRGARKNLKDSEKEMETEEAFDHTLPNLLLQ